MAIISGTRKILKSDIPKAPAWFDPIISILNEFLDTVIGGLRGKLTFSDNFYVDIKTLTFTHGEEKKIFFSGVNTYEGILVLKGPQTSDTDLAVTGHVARVVGPQTLGITFLFNGAGSTEGEITFCILG